MIYLTIVFGQLGPTLLPPDDPGSEPQIEKLPGTNCFGTSSQIAHLENVEFWTALYSFFSSTSPSKYARGTHFAPPIIVKGSFVDSPSPFNFTTPHRDDSSGASPITTVFLETKMLDIRGRRVFPITCRRSDT